MNDHHMGQWKPIVTATGLLVPTRQASVTCLVPAPGPSTISPLQA